MKTKHISTKRKAYIALMRTLMAIAAILTGALVLFLIVYVLAKGMPQHLLGAALHHAQLPVRQDRHPAGHPEHHLHRHRHPGHRAARWAWARPST